MELLISNDSVVKNPLVNAGDAGSIPDSGSSPAIGNGNPLQYSWEYWEIPWMEEPGGLQSLRSQRVGHDLTIKKQIAVVLHSVLESNPFKPESSF